MAVQLRTQRAGDLGWVFQRHAELYPGEFSYSPVFEQYVARGMSPFLDHFDAKRDRMWIAESEGRRLGSVAVHHVDDRPGWAKLRWYFVEAEARGHGVGGKLLGAAIGFCREAGYEGVFLWTVNDLAAAARQYSKAGFVLVFEESKPCAWAPWGREQRWELNLPPLRRP